MNKQKTYFTREGLARTNNEIISLQKDIKICNAKIGKTVELDNDLRENPEFMALRTKAEYELPNKIQELARLLEHKEIIEDMPHIRGNLCNYVSVGHQVTLIDEYDNSRMLTILGYGDSNPKENIVSYLTPIAQILLEHEVGDEVSLPTLHGSTLYEIDEIIISPLLNE
ncbi:GreA/GreB family elongation factor [Providencia rettgeri]|uniref:GreA/GreB family elongation factor n=1 Tax=Providencia TaxID=586 RepID=UPI00201D4579|nr:GreA/GreB family elongation factor [Providencia stuartii]EJD6411164.1 GreA/GreB family elongation factor [Providencia rettgeri]ELR5074568.1 GreA/GreB family elongation factor [Providencia stuartii]UQZ13325.1 GreA/GreB family elongation factor [Providencia stuartii]HEP0304985.1 GreA/GreB family elongation factor [Providencia rettgeri]